MILAVDTYYAGTMAKTVGVAFLNWSDKEPFKIYTDNVGQVAPYESGSFYKRELPCILRLLKQVELSKIQAIIIDGFVFLDDDGQPGLGAYLFKGINEVAPVIGVAKTNFATVHTSKRAVRTGKSARPLFVTAIGMNVDDAAECIAGMHGEYRMPTLLKLLDRLTRE